MNSPTAQNVTGASSPETEAARALEANCGGALAGRQVQAVLDQIGATGLRDLARQQPGVVDVLAIEPHFRAEGGDLAQLERAGSSRRHDSDGQASMPAAVGQRPARDSRRSRTPRVMPPSRRPRLSPSRCRAL
jgi:hypothetical protein